MSTIFNVKDYGAQGTGFADDTGAIQAAINALLASTWGGTLHFPGGRYLINGSFNVTVPEKKTFLLDGESKQLSTLVHQGLSDLFTISYNKKGGLAGEKGFIGARELSFQTNQPSTTTAIRLISLNGSGSAPQKQFNNLTMAGTNGTSGWERGIQLEDVAFARIEDLTFQGDPSTNLGTAVRIIGTDTPVDTVIRGARVNHAKNGVKVEGSVEGVYVTDSVMIEVTRGVFWDTPGEEPLLRITGCHINSWEHCVRSHNLIQAIICDNLFYQLPDSPFSWVGIQMDGDWNGATSFSQISHNIIHGFGGSGPENGIVLDNLQGTIVSNNIIYNVDTGIWLRSGTTNCKVLDNQVIQHQAYNVYNQGTANRVTIP